MLYRLPSEFCAYFTPFLGLNWRWFGPVRRRCDKWLAELQRQRVPHRHGSGHGVSRYLCEIQ